MVLYSYYIFLACACALFGLAYSDPPPCYNDDMEWECRQDWDTGKCSDRAKDVPDGDRPIVCRCYCIRDLDGDFMETKEGQCVPFEECDWREPL